jgi:hypothetical protein
MAQGTLRGVVDDAGNISMLKLFGSDYFECVRNNGTECSVYINANIGKLIGMAPRSLFLPLLRQEVLPLVPAGEVKIEISHDRLDITCRRPWRPFDDHNERHYEFSGRSANIGGVFDLEGAVRNVAKTCTKVLQVSSLPDSMVINLKWVMTTRGNGDMYLRMRDMSMVDPIAREFQIRFW